ncbi:hypothetical protein ASPFODRAFT_224944 [Aspergillus luchuensis CBS 106.47]|uniref:Uncharacterized protein n=1 Tax=Aspergillus luchuensis (strain CBS 106.47) TaxID=1137211 RepID=A0A1M3TXU5_ASPLC|nr:hypothetical protein ASPFODRAFT_224944 [Aspergillus luchuensis CBS 106.47]
MSWSRIPRHNETPRVQHWTLQVCATGVSIFSHRTGHVRVIIGIILADLNSLVVSDGARELISGA